MSKAAQTNEQIKILKVTSLTTEVNYQYLEKDKTYVPIDSRVVLVIKMLGNELPMITAEKYTFKK